MLHKMKYLNCISLLYLPYFFWEIENSSLQETRTEHFGCKFLLTLAGWVAGFYLPCSDTSRYVHVMLDS